MYTFFLKQNKSFRSVLNSAVPSQVLHNTPEIRDILHINYKLSYISEYKYLTV